MNPLKLPALLFWARRQHPETLMGLLARARRIQQEDLDVAAIFRAGMAAGRLQERSQNEQNSSAPTAR